MKKLYRFFAIILTLLLAASSMYAGSPRISLVEEATGLECGVCASFNPSFHPWLQQNEDKAVALVYVSSNYNPAPDFITPRVTRVGLYESGSFGIPAVYVNGAKATTRTIPAIQTTVNQAYGQTSPITINLIETRDGNNVALTAIVHSDEAISGNKQLFVGVGERYISKPGVAANGEDEFHYVARKIMPGAYNGTSLQLQADERKTFNFQFTIDDSKWDPDEIYAVAFVQNMDTREVLQAARTMDPDETYSQIETSANSIKFGDNTDPITKTLIVSNSGYKPLVIDDIMIENSFNGVFEVVSLTETVVNYLDEYELQVKFTPKENKEYSTSLKIRSNSDMYPNKKISLSGKGVGIVLSPDIQFNMAELDFGNVGETLTKTVEVSNVGQADLEIESIVIEDDTKGVFEVLTTNFPVMAPGDDPLEVQVKFTPVKNGEFTGTLNIVSNDPNGGNTLGLVGNGEGVISVLPEISFNLNEFVFGKVSDTKTIDLEVTNSGKGTLSITEISIDADYDNIYTVISETPSDLAINETFTVKVQFTPAENEIYYGFLTVKSNADNYPAKTFALSGEGEGVQPKPRISIDKSELDFGTQKSITSLPIVIKNTGTADLELTNMEIEDENGVFDFVTSDKPSPISAGNSYNIVISFEPKANQTYNANLKFHSNAGGGTDHTIALTGIGDASSVEENGRVSNAYITMSVGPNPFSTATTLNYEVNGQVSRNVNIKVFDALGNEVKQLVSGAVAPGAYQAEFNAAGLANGVYYLVANVDGHVSKLQMVVMD